MRRRAQATELGQIGDERRSDHDSDRGHRGEDLERRGEFLLAGDEGLDLTLHRATLVHQIFESSAARAP